MRFRVLGQLQVRAENGWTAIRAGQQRVVLAVLLAEAGRVVSADRLIDEIWGPHPPKSAPVTVQGYVARLRRLLGGSRAGALLTRDRGYELAVSDGEVDASRFHGLVTAGRRGLADGEVETALARLTEGLELWQGPALSDVPASPTVTGYASRLEESRLDAREVRLDALLELGRHPEAAAEAGTLVEERPYRERSWAQLMLALYRGGRREARAPLRPIEALAAFLVSLGVPSERVPVEVEDASALFRSLLAGKRMLVLLDNAHRAEQVRPLLPGSGGCLVVLTSRDRLASLVARNGAVRLDLDVLAPDEAHTLLGLVLGAERVDAEPEPARQLARLCGYLPLALRIAAANPAARPRTRIAGYLRLLGGDDRLATLQVDGDPRAGVRATFNHSYSTLPDDPRRLFRRLDSRPRWRPARPRRRSRSPGGSGTGLPRAGHSPSWPLSTSNSGTRGGQPTSPSRQ